jgi:hypothetical protein
MSFTLKNTPKLIFIFFLIQIIVNLNSSLTAFPFLHFGMFSEKITLKPSYQTYQIEVDNQVLNGMDYGIHEWEIMQTPIIIKENIEASNDFEKDKLFISFFLEKLGLSFFNQAVSENLNNAIESDQIFNINYKKYLEKVLNKKIEHVKVYTCQFIFKDNQYLLLDKKVIVNL